jgi:hypothetical protein
MQEKMKCVEEVDSNQTSIRTLEDFHNANIERQVCSYCRESMSSYIYPPRVGVMFIRPT